MTLELLNQVVDTDSNESGFRIIGKKGIATNLLTTISVDNLQMPEDIDCFVAADSLVEVYKKAKKPVFSQDEKNLIMKDGKSTDSFALKDSSFFPTIPDPEGEEIPVADLLDVFRALEPFKTSSKSFPISDLMFFVDGFAYVITENMAVRIPTTTKFPNAITLPRSFSSLLASIKAPPIVIKYNTSKNITIMFENMWIRTSTSATELPISIKQFEYFEDEKAQFEKPELDLLSKMTEYSNFGKKAENVISFSPNGVRLIEAGKVERHYDCKMPVSSSYYASSLKGILGKITEFDFTDARRLWFKGEGGIQGILSAASTQTLSVN